MKVNYQSTSKADHPTLEKGIKVEYAPAKRGGMRWRWYFLIAMITIPLILLFWFILRPSLFVLAPGILTTEPLEMKAHHKGVLAQLNINPGEQVVKDQVLARLTNSELAARLNELKRQLAKLESIPDNDNVIIEQLQQQVKVAQVGVRRQSNLLNQFESFKQRGLVPAADMAAVQQAHTSAQMALEQARIELLRTQQRQQQERQAGVISQARNNILLQLVELEARVEELTVKAPFSARVADLLVQQGEYITEQQPLLWLSGRSQPVVVSYLDPRYLDYVHLGQTANVKLPNGTRLNAVINEPTELVSKIPSQLSGPFDGEKPALKVTLTLNSEQSVQLSRVEGVPVEVSFNRFGTPLFTTVKASLESFVN